jgi:hypothetical protein
LKKSDLLIQKFVQLMDIAQGQIDQILVKCRDENWNEKLAKVCLAWQSKLNA